MSEEFCTDWTVVIPVKPAAIGKSRLAATGSARADLARAIALDTIAAAAAVCRVIVVTDDAEVAAAARGLGADAVAETPSAASDADGTAETPARGLNAAIATGVAVARAGGATNCAALLGDLPALRPADLAAALREAATADRAVVADAEGTGSTLVTARAGVPWAASFGDGSFARHVEAGCVALHLPDASTLRRDVDTPAQLAAAARLGLGPHTIAVRSGGR
ncbi:2-phospho-L-lactate guanylyltransferase [Microbacterium kribbense]|uniref:2-phospho-L-lactate guanylyltransferase n=1 Tax=Microbacterium kribbense TaxID=433645 RepID=UPI0031D6C497